MKDYSRKPADLSPKPKPDEVPKASRSFFLSIIAVLLGVIAMGLAIIPSLAFERPLPNPFAEKKEPPPPEPKQEAEPETEGGFTFSFKGFSVNLGGKKAKPEKPPEPRPEPKPAENLKLNKDPVRWFTISAVGTALAGLVVSSLAQFREKHTPLTSISLVCCIAAISWQYVAIGIMIGVILAVILVVFVPLIR